ncbi:MAG TPA: hypothetical protein VH373_18780 [Jatrophihabitantaceae bacterium]|jgi:hypothetical protein
MAARQITFGAGILLAGLVVAGCSSTAESGSGASPTPRPTMTTSAIRAVTTSPPASTPTSSGSAPTTTPTPAPSTHKVPPDAQYPAAGSCPKQTASPVRVQVDPDIPVPRCVVVSPGQDLTVVNNTNELHQAGSVVTITWADYAPRRLKIGASTSYTQPFGNYLMPGVHRLHISLYGQSGAEVWLQG